MKKKELLKLLGWKEELINFFDVEDDKCNDVSQKEQSAYSDSPNFDLKFTIDDVSLFSAKK